MALSADTTRTSFVAKNIELPGTAQTVYKNGIACWDTSTGLVAKYAASATMIPIGRFAEGKVVASGGTVVVDLFRELQAEWIPNHGSDTIVAADLGKLAYLADDNTVRKTDNSNANSVAGRIWKLDTVKGVLVEFIQTGAAHLSGLDT